jgi:sulfite exporter TauE/SafE
VPFLKVLGSGLVLGLTLSPACVGACFPLLVPYFASEKRPFASDVRVLLYFLCGRLTGYAAAGATAGWIGGLAIGFLHRPTTGAWVSICTGFLLMLYGFVKSFPHLSFCAQWAGWEKGRRTALGLGLLSGLGLCPPFLAALVQAGQSGSVLAGCGLLAAFFVGTSLILVPVLLAGRAAAYEPLRYASRLASMFIGAWFVFQGTGRLLIGP